RGRSYSGDTVNIQAMRRFASRRSLIALGTIALGVVVALLAASWVREHPSSSDASIDADVVHVAAAVGGRIIEIRVVENSRGHRGDLLFQIDPLPYQLQVSQAHSDLAVAEAHVATQRSHVSTQRSNP